jgi:acylphosphatase
VRNLHDGGVEVLAVGSPKILEQLRNDLWSGPIGASVTAVQESEAPVEGFRSFDISY